MFLRMESQLRLDKYKFSLGELTDDIKAADNVQNVKIKHFIPASLLKLEYLKTELNEHNVKYTIV